MAKDAASRTPAAKPSALPEGFPEGLKPRLRLFFSVDLEGATHYKQSHNTWRPEILRFYRDFDLILQSEFHAFASNYAGPLKAPEYWKSNGDELLYTCELTSLSHAYALMHVWIWSLHRYQLQREPGAEHLEAKSTAWIGLFPTPNAEVFFRRGGAVVDSDLSRDAIIVQSELRDEWYANPSNASITREFVGPSIDTGFRLTSWATPHQLILSVDLAFLLTSGEPEGIGPLTLRLSGKQKLKGVIDDQPYPTLWIPVGGLGLARSAGGPVVTDRAEIRSACEAVIEQNYQSITPLFLDDRQDGYDWAPPYILKRILALWEDEQRHVRGASRTSPSESDAA
ncbi:hypothetical protein [Phenylobacterium sp.]|uniref:hypothetical protein n=1 Tax=Phenylobacterium sp. TaxID=1871053 RepID=UPI00301BB33A